MFRPQHHTPGTRILFGIAGCLAVCCLAATAQADFLRLDSGESFTGTLVHVKSGLLKFKTSLSGQVMAPMNTVAMLESERPFVITLTDGATRYGRFVNAEDAGALQNADAPPEPIVLAEVQEALEVPGGKSGTWTAETSLNMQARSGITDSLEPSARLELRGSVEGGGEAAMELEVDRSDPERFPAYARARVERFPAEETGPYLAFEAERATDRTLEWRTGVTLGVGRWLQAWGGRTWLATLGIQPSYESWSAADLIEAGAVPDSLAERAAETGRLNLHLGGRFGLQLGERTEFEQRVTLLPDLLAPGEFRAASETALSRAFSDNLRLRLHLLLEYTTDPLLAPADPWNASLGAGIAFEF
jgi:hypothetical protein